MIKSESDSEAGGVHHQPHLPPHLSPRGLLHVPGPPGGTLLFQVGFKVSGLLLSKTLIPHDKTPPLSTKLGQQ